MKDKEFLQWIHDRIVVVYGENRNYDFMHKLRAVIAVTPEDQATTNVVASFN